MANGGIVMIRKMGFVSAIVLCGIGSVGAADAAIVTKTFDIVATNFFDQDTDAPAPFSSHSGKFVVTLNDSAEGLASVVASDLNFSINSPYAAYYIPGMDRLTIGGTAGANGPRTVQGAAVDTWFVVLNALSNPTFGNSVFSAGTGTEFYASLTGTVNAAVPDVATWAMFIGGFGLTGAVMRRRKIVAHFG
jgi:hypothetical protein